MSRTLLRHKELDRIRLVSVTRRQNSTWVGSTLADLVAARNGHPSDVLADWVLDNDGDPGVVALGVANADPEGVADLVVFDPGSLVWHEEELVADLPGRALRLRRPPGGFRYTLLGGLSCSTTARCPGRVPARCLRPAP